MKICKIALYNLNSLQGRYEIDFTRPEFAAAGLFAITGETGAGKTTLLDAVTLALYGQVPRQCEPRAVMSHGCGECYAAVEFSVDRARYRAKWSVRRARGRPDGKLQDARYELARLGEKEEILAEKKKEFDNLIRDLLQLDFDRFRRSVMLAQGAFDAFLKADKNKRGEILERITGTEIYACLSQKAFELARAQQQKLEHLESRLDLGRLLSAEQIGEHQAKLAELQQQAAQLDARRREAETRLAWRRTLGELETRRKTLHNELQGCEARRAAFAPHRSRLDEHRRAQPFAADLNWLAQREQDLAKCEADIQRFQEEYEQAAYAHAQAEQALGTARQTLAAAQRGQQEAAPRIAEALRLEQHLATHRATLHEAERALAQAQQQLDTVCTDLATKTRLLDQTVKEHDTVQAWRRAHQLDVELEAALGRLEAQCEQLGEQQRRYTELQHAAQDHAQALARAKQAHADAENAYSETRRALAQTETELEARGRALAELSDASGSEELEHRYEEAARHLRDLEQLDTLAQAWGTRYAELQGIAQAVLEQQALALRQEARATSHEALVNEAEALLQSLQTQYEQALRIKNYEAERALLQAGEACPLCGSTSHPLVSEYHDSSEENKRRVTAQKRKLTQLHKELQQRREQLTASRTRLDGLGEQQTRLLQHQDAAVNTFAEKVRGQALPAELTPATLPLLQHALDQGRAQAGDLHRIFKQAHQLQQDLHRAERAHQDALLAAEQAHGTVRRGSERLRVGQQQLAASQAELARVQVQLEQTRDTLRTRLHGYGEDLDAAPADTLLQRLRRRAREWERHNQRRHELDKRLSSLRSEQDSLRAQRLELERRLAQHQAVVQHRRDEVDLLAAQRRAAFPEDDLRAAQARLEQAVENARAQVEQRTRQQHAAHNRLSGISDRLAGWRTDARKLGDDCRTKRVELDEKAGVQGFAGVEGVREALLDPEDAEQLRTEAEALDTTHLQLGQSLRDCEAEWRTQQARALSEKDAPALERESADLQRAQAELQQTAGALRGRLEHDEHMRREYAELEQAIARRRETYLRWARLADLIGSRDGWKFRNYAQRLTLERLVQAANHHLHKLNPRYRIVNRLDDSLELEIIDRYQAEARRPMNTLSGGESFLVSLALALGLSDLASHHTEIASLFIDEGFGTLDSTTLDTVLSTLENLRAEGKLVGVISHVPALQERIATQIQVLKQGGGVSRVELSFP